MQAMRAQYGSWFHMVAAMGALDECETTVAVERDAFLREVETTAMTKCFKMILLEAMSKLNGWEAPPSLLALAICSLEVLRRRPHLLADLPESTRKIVDGTDPAWQKYWIDNPVNAWIGGNRTDGPAAHFTVLKSQFLPNFEISATLAPAFEAMVQELVELRLAQYEMRRSATSSNVVPFTPPSRDVARVSIPYFPSLKIACGHFRTSAADVEEYRELDDAHGRLDPARHFIARARGDSMDGGKAPIRDGDYLLFEHLSPTNAGSLTGSIIAIERSSSGGGSEYLLRVIAKSAGVYVLRAQNPQYDEMPATNEMRTLARLKEILNPLEMAVSQSFMREEIPELFGESFNPGNWLSGHVILDDKKAHILLVTLNKQGKAIEHRYTDHWLDGSTFHWQSQNSTTPQSRKGKQIIEHQQNGIAVHLFVRESKLRNGKASPFKYHGKVRYLRHTGSAPMNIQWELE